jgi:hypothetical protein
MYFNPIVGFTMNHSFVFTANGKVSMKEYASTSESLTKTCELVKYGNLSVVKSDILKSLFPHSNGRLENVQMSDLCLPKAANRTLSNRKITSLALKAKLFVTSEQRNYYPMVNEDLILDTSGNEPVVKKSKKSSSASILNQKLLKENFPFSELVGDQVNTFVFPSLAAGNITYKMLQELGAAEAIGPVLLGLKKSAHVLQLGSSIREIVNMVMIAVIDAQSKSSE